MKKRELSPEQREELLRSLKARFEKNMNRPDNCGNNNYIDILKG